MSVQLRDSVFLLTAEKHKGKIQHRSTSVSQETEKLQFALSLLISWMFHDIMTLYLSALFFCPESNREKTAGC